MEGFLSSGYISHEFQYQYQYQYQYEYGDSGSPSAERAPPPTEIKLAEHNPKRRAGRKKFKETRHPVYRGIRQRNSGKWVGELREPNTKARVWLGTFPTAEMAARAYDVAVIALRGRSACLNFADSVSLSVPETGDIKEIQRAATEAAEAFRPKSSETEGEAAGVATPSSVSGVAEDQFVVDEDFFEMAEILTDMYNGMMLPPPYEPDDGLEYDVDFNLWNF